MSNTDVVRLLDPSDNFRSSGFDVGYSYCNGRCQVSVCCVRFCTISVACNEVAVVVVLTENVV